MKIARRIVAVVATSIVSLAAAQNKPDVTSALQWRLVGPFRGGWSTVAQGSHNEPNTFYFGAAGGGVWKSTDAGATWHPIFDSINASNIGAMAVAPSDSRVIYVGTGQVTSRYDIASGDGVYKSTDGGETWQHAGLQDTGAFGTIAVDPRDANVVLAAAFGHAFGPNVDRGIFRSADGGKTWTKTLFVDDTTGAVDVAIDPSNPDIVFASIWRQRFWPWLQYFMPEEDARTAIYKSTDGGRTWKRVSGHGWPDEKLSRIGVAVTSVHGATRVYAAVSSDDVGGLYRSDDGGANWQHVNDDKDLASSYFAMLTVAPDDPNVVYVMGRSVSRCDNGGAHCAIFKGAPGGDDYHQLWINPQFPDHMIVASDQGTAVSLNGGRTWSDWYNQPTGQFYHLAADNRFPYWIYSGQQDSGTAGVASRSDYGVLSFRDWHPVGGDERDYDLPDPQDANIIYGSGLGGRLSRWNARNGEAQNVSPWPIASYGVNPTKFQYRYTWITPIAISPLPPYPLYQGAQVLFRSNDRGANWSAISPDVSAKSRAKNCEGDELAPKDARECGYGVIYSIGLSPRDNNDIWIGTDDGLIQHTSDGGAHWSNVTPKSITPWAKIASVDVSAATPGSVYVAVDTHRLDQFHPHVLRTRDNGKTWTEIDAGLPATSFVDVVRADPVSGGLLYAGTDHGVFVSFDDGDHWQSLQRNLPSAWVRDLLVHGDDLIAATQGRAIWVLDDVAPLRQFAKIGAGNSAVLLEPAAAIRVRGSQNRDTPPPADTALGTNPPDGALLDYWLPSDAKNIKLEIRDETNSVIRTITTSPDDATAERYFTKTWAQPEPTLSALAGMHRYVWNLRTQRPRATRYEYSIAAVFGALSPLTPGGMLVAPGKYTASLNFDGQRFDAPIDVRADPRVAVDAQALRSAMTFSRDVYAALDRNYIAYAELDFVNSRVADIEKQSPGAAMKSAVAKYKAAAKPLKAGDGDTTDNLGAIGEVLSTLAADVEASDVAPTQPQRDVLVATQRRLDRAVAQWTVVKSRELPRLSDALRAAGQPAIDIPPPNAIRIKHPPESKDLP
jgi:photosystem II stability/assembly factor-like uncharacterized protein